jgi:hypothetical protein
MVVRVLYVMYLFLLLAGLVVPGLAQDPSAFATNTPAPLPAAITTPAAPMDRYALRQWQAGDLLDVLQTRVRQLTPGAGEIEKAIRLTQYELVRRFPGAPRTISEQAQLLDALLNAPVGSVDARMVARPFIVAALNDHANLQPFTINGFLVEPIAVDLDGRDPLDAVLHVQYPADALPLRYVDYIAVVGTINDAYQLLVTNDLPAAPLGTTTGLMLVGAADFNGDGLDELAVTLTTGDLNQEMRIFGWRGGSLVNLVQPGSKILFGEVTNGLLDVGDLSVKVYREASPAWQCRETLDVRWRWDANFYRPVPDPTGYFFENTANCLFYGAEPFFAQEIPEALLTLSQIKGLAPSETDYSAQRASMTQAMLRLFSGDVGSALALALELEAQAEPDSWLAQQTGAFISALDEADVKPLTVCAALLSASEYGACDIDSALTRLFEEQPLSRDEPIDDQLTEMGISVLHQVTVSEVGKVDREVVHFQMGGVDHWWAFAPLDRDFYSATLAEPLPQFAPMPVPVPVLVAPPSMYEALLVNNDPLTVLTTLDNLLRENPQAAVSPELRFLEALSLDLLANRSRARQAYYELWRAAPRSVWGQLAADHLEQR